MENYINSDNLKNMTTAEIEILNYINENAEIIHTMSIEKVANDCFVSKTTIVRTAQKLGYKGFTDLKYDFKNKNIKEEKSIVHDIVKVRNNDINNTNQLLLDEDFKMLALKMINKKINFFGKGLNECVCEYISNQLLLLGIHAIHIQNTDVAYSSIKYMNDDDLFFIISASGETKQCINVALKAKEKGIEVCSLTKATKNTLSKLSDDPYYVFLSEDNRVDFDNISRVPMLLFFHKLIDEIIDIKVRN